MQLREGLATPSWLHWKTACVLLFTSRALTGVSDRASSCTYPHISTRLRKHIEAPYIKSSLHGYNLTVSCERFISHLRRRSRTIIRHVYMAYGESLPPPQTARNHPYITPRLRNDTVLPDFKSSLHGHSLTVSCERFISHLRRRSRTIIRHVMASPSQPPKQLTTIPTSLQDSEMTQCHLT